MESKDRLTRYELRLKEETLATISNFTFFYPNLTPMGWSDRAGRIIQFLLNEELLTKQETIDCLGQRIKTLGRDCFNQQVNAGTPPNLTGFPEMFAYALAHGEFSDKELLRVKFDHGENLTSFIREHKADDASLLHKILQNTLPKQRHLATA